MPPVTLQQSHAIKRVTTPQLPDQVLHVFVVKKGTFVQQMHQRIPIFASVATVSMNMRATSDEKSASHPMQDILI